MKPEKRWSFGILASLLTVLIIEMCSFLLLSLSTGHLMTPARIRAIQLQVSEASDGGPEATKEAQANAPTAPRQVGAEVVHPYLGFVLDSKFHRILRRQNGGRDALDFGFSLNEPGLFHDPSSGRSVVAITGGSVAFNLVSKITPELRHELLAELPGFENAIIVNLALPGYKQPQQLFALSYFLALGAHFDLVINLDGFNEVTLPLSENFNKGVNPFFPRNWFFRVQDFASSTRLAVGELAYLIDRRRKRAELFAGKPWQHSPTAGLLWTVLDRHAQSEISQLEIELHSDSELVAASYTVTGPPWNPPDTEASYKELVQFWVRTSEQMHHLTQARGIRYYHFLQPNQYLAGSKPMSDDERRVAIQLEGYSYSEHAVKAYPMLVEHGRRLIEQGIEYHDLTMVFAEIEEPVYIDRCCHLNILGERIVTRAMAAAIRDDLLQTEDLLQKNREGNRPSRASLLPST